MGFYSSVGLLWANWQWRRRLPARPRAKQILVALSVPISMHATMGFAEETEAEVPSTALLEFLAEFGALDEPTFELIVIHGLDDADKTKQESMVNGRQNKQGTAAELAEQERENGSQ